MCYSGSAINSLFLGVISPGICWVNTRYPGSAVGLRGLHPLPAAHPSTLPGSQGQHCSGRGNRAIPQPWPRCNRPLKDQISQSTAGMGRDYQVVVMQFHVLQILLNKLKTWSLQPRPCFVQRPSQGLRYSRDLPVDGQGRRGAVIKYRRI